MQSVNIEGLKFAYKNSISKRNILDGISISARGNENIAIIGANGVGKSTLLKLLVGLNIEYEGKILINGVEVRKETLSEIRTNTGYVFQDSESQLFMSTVYDDVSFAPRNYGFSKEEVDKRTNEALDKVHITHLKNRHIYTLSGGEKKLAAIAGILSMNPSIILMDEPTIALDPKNRRNIIHILNEIKALKIIATHDLDMVMDTCERTILLSEGKVIKDGATEEILRDKELLENNGLELPLSLQ